MRALSLHQNSSRDLDQQAQHRDPQALLSQAGSGVGRMVSFWGKEASPALSGSQSSQLQLPNPSFSLCSNPDEVGEGVLR